MPLLQAHASQGWLPQARLLKCYALPPHRGCPFIVLQ